uniref:TonB-dependent transporter Oar-like beta-barrel domain-containing protein n=1 Tax=uncultured bacterium 213 TaxID=698383 RepID=E3T6W8_9BACT|nr:hypothetical protein [uncultured bacterium 213]
MRAGEDAQAGPAAGCSIAGSVTASSRIPLPGVVLSLATADGQVVDVTSSAADGSFLVKVPGPGAFTLKGELVAFAPLAQAVAADASDCHPHIDLVMTLASRISAAASSPDAAGDGATRRGALPSGGVAPAGEPLSPRGRGQNGRGQGGGRGQPPQQFQSLALLADQAGLARPDDTDKVAESAAQTLLPPGFSPETSAESVTALGSTQGAESFFGPGDGDRLEQMREALGGAGGFPGAAGGQEGGRGGPGGGPGFGGGFGGRGGFGARGRGNQIRGSVYQSIDTSGLDAGPVALNGQQTRKPDYLQQRFGATLGGPLAIPKVFNAGSRTFFFLNYTGNHSSNPYDQYSTVPTDAERAGDLSALPHVVIDPATQQPFAGNQIPMSELNPAALKLLNLIPSPNQPGTTQNFHTVTTTTSALDDLNVRVVHTFGAQPPGPGRGGRNGRGGGGGRGGGSNLNIGIHYRRSDSTNQNPFPTLGGTSKLSAWDVPVSYSFTTHGIFSTLRLGFNRQHGETTNLYANGSNIAGDAGILGVSTDPFDWGAPGLSFSSFASLRDVNPSMRTDQTVSIGDTMVKQRGKHTMRFGGDYRDIRADTRTDSNARGSFVFTGLYTGIDFADFLLGLPQQATVQYGPLRERFHQRTWDLFLQDDWRPTASLTVNAGLRYEYYSPFSEADNHLATLDAAPGFTAAVPVLAGATGPYSGALPDTIVRPFRTGFAPRIGIAWKPQPATTVRTGYGINYSSGVYQSIAQQLAGQPPFAVTNTVLATAASPATLETALTTAAPGVTPNTYGVDPNYRLGYVQIWNLDVQRDLTRTLTVGIGYVGTRGSNLDTLRAPNRGPSGLRIADVQPFTWESSQGESIMHSLSFRFRKRLTGGLAAGGTYTLSKSIDDASSIGGAGAVVAQNDQDLAAERGLSSFDQRHRVSGDFTYELPFGANRRWFHDGASAALLGNWVINGNAQVASGTPFTAHVLADSRDVGSGTNGTLRADYNGEPIQLDNPTPALFFNTAAFSIPAPGTFGNAGRNTIIGPGTSNVNLGLTRNITFGQNRTLSIQILASNVFNTVQFASIDTIVNSPTFGRVTSVRAMRRVQVLTRLRF